MEIAGRLKENAQDISLEPQRAFLLACLRLGMASLPAQIPTVPPELDWEQFFRQVVANRVAGLCYLTGKRLSGLWPAEFQERLQKKRYNDLVQRSHQAEQVGEALSALGKAGIKPVALKGWAMIETIYGGDYSLRPCDDLDILVLPQERTTAEATLVRLGYRALVELWPGQRLRYGNTAWHYQQHVEIPTRQDGFEIDLHWGLFNLPYYDACVPLETVLKRARPIKVCGAAAWQLCPEDVLLHACGHLGLHHPHAAELNRFYELAHLVRQAGAELDWTAMAAQASAWKLTAPFQQVVLEMEADFPGTIPTQAADILRDLQPAPGEARSYRWTVKYHDTPWIALLPARWTPAAALMTVGYLFEAFFPSPAFLKWRYGPSRFWPLHYLYRLKNSFGQWSDFRRNLKK